MIWADLFLSQKKPIILQVFPQPIKKEANMTVGTLVHFMLHAEDLRKKDLDVNVKVKTTILFLNCFMVLGPRVPIINY